MCSSPLSRAIRARSRASISAPTPASRALRSTSSWKASGSSMRSGFRPTGFYRTGSASCSSARRATSERGPPVRCQFHLSGWKLEQAAPGDRQGRVASGRALSARRVHRHQPVAPGRAGRRLLQQAGHMRTMDQGRQGRDQVNPAVVPNIRCERGAASASCTRLQSRQLPAHARDARADEGLVADEPEGETDQDRREGRQPRPLCRLSDGRGRHPTADAPGDFTADCGTTAAATTSASVRGAMVMGSRATDGSRASKCQQKWPDQTLDHRAGYPRCR